MQQYKKENTVMNKLKNYSEKIIFYLIGAIVVFSILFLTVGVYGGDVTYAMRERVPKLLVIILTGISIGMSTVIFQCITNNKILTPSVLGLDSLYILIQSLIVFFLGSGSIFISNKIVNFILSVICMVNLVFLLYKFLFGKNNLNIIFLSLFGVVIGTFFSSFSSFLQLIMDPNEFLVLQSKLFASFNNVSKELIIVGIVFFLLIIPVIYDDFKYLDIISLGKDHSINLGINYDKISKKFLVVVGILISISTALIGPITFLGLLVVSIAREKMKGYSQVTLITITSLMAILVLIVGQFLIERILKISLPISVLINLIGGIYFIYLIFKESKI